MHTDGHTNDATAQSADRLIPFSSARSLVGLSRSKIYLLMAENDFPAPVKIGRNNYFSVRELQAWIVERLAARKADGDADKASIRNHSDRAGGSPCQ